MGLPCGEDVEVSVNLVAPDRAGRYVSHWRLASPSGQKFGHRVWVLILVVVQGDESPQLEEPLKGPEKTVEVEESTFDVQDVPLDEMDVDHKGGASSSSTEPPIHMPDADEEAQLEMEAELDGFSLIEKPVENISEANGNASGEPVERILPGKEKMEENQEELLNTLESMGFMNRDLNFLLLDKNNGDLEDTLDDLLLSAGWDGILKDLEEMVQY
jgi:next-to-BRCA1 protein 1